MPALFSLGQHSALVAVQEQLGPDERLFAFLDDTYVTSSPNKEGFMDTRTNPDLKKTQIWNQGGEKPPGCDALTTDAQRHDPNANVWKGDRALSLDLIPQVQDIQTAWLLLLFCAVPRPNYFLRMLHPEATRVFAAQHVSSVKRC